MSFALNQNRIVQTKLKIGEPNDRFEREADTVADQVMKISASPAPSVQRKCAACEEEELQMKPLSSSISPLIQKTAKSTTGEAPAAISKSLSGKQGGGQTLDHETQTFMSKSIGVDFSDVKIHTDGKAIQMNRQLNAKAFTHGNDIYFNQGQYSPGSSQGKHLLAHELTHVVQQSKGIKPEIQRLGDPFGPAAAGPADWSTQVSNATTSAQKTALLQNVVGRSVRVNDATAASASDPVPDPAHLTAFSLTSPVINFDQNLRSKRARVGRRPLVINAGYTFRHRSAIYVIIADAALDGSNYNQTMQTVNHEFDHVNQYLRSSGLTGNASELDAWTTGFIREFHHSYQFRPTDDGSRCYVELKPRFAPLAMYYQGLNDDAQKARAVRRISSYYNATISSNVANRHAFRYWVYGVMRGRNNPDLGRDLNNRLSLGIDSSAGRNTYRATDCASIRAANLPGSSVLALPTAPSGGRSGGTRPNRK